MVRVLATVVVGMMLAVGPFGLVGAASANATIATPICTAEDGSCGSEHCPTDVHNYIWRIPAWLEECQN